VAQSHGVAYISFIISASRGDVTIHRLILISQPRNKAGHSEAYDYELRILT